MWQSVHMCILPREIVDHVVMAMDFYGTYVKNTIEDNIIPSNQSLKYMVQDVWIWEKELEQYVA